MTAKPKSAKAAPPDPAPLSIGVIADTHGVLCPSVPRLFAGVSHIIHAGDVGKRAVLRELERVAPLTAVCGNADTGKLAASLPATATGEIGGWRFLVVHKPKAVKRLLPAAQRDGVRLIIMGHLHEPGFRWEDGILYLNPGSASAPEEGDTQPTVAVVSVLPEGLAVTFIPVPRMPAALSKSRAKPLHARSGAKAGGPEKTKTSAAGHGKSKDAVTVPGDGRPRTTVAADESAVAETALPGPALLTAPGPDGLAAVAALPGLAEEV